MKKLRYSIALGIVGLCISFLSVGCGGEADPEDLSNGAAGSLSASTLEGADEVIMSVEGEDYKRAISTLVKMKRRVKGDDQVQFMILAREVKDLLLQAAGTNPRAGQALTALRMMSSGR